MTPPFPFEDRFYEVQPLTAPYVMRSGSQPETEISGCGVSWLTALCRLGFALAVFAAAKRLWGWFRSP
jgi:hypothetical protein